MKLSLQRPFIRPLRRGPPLDKSGRVWQYIVEEKNIKHNILCSNYRRKQEKHND